MSKRSHKKYKPNEITHPVSDLIPQKFRFFADCLDLVNNDAGEYYCFEVETHLSLVHSLIYFIENELNKYDKRRAERTISHVKYILSTHPLMNSTDILVKTFYSSILLLVSKIQNSAGGSRQTLQQIKSDLQCIEKTFQSDYIKNIVKRISLHINCAHKLTTHVKDFDYYAKLIFSYFYLNRYSQRDISTFVKQVLEKEVTIEGNKIFVEGPLPVELHNKLIAHNRSVSPLDMSLLKEIEDYYKNRNMEQQIAGFLNLAMYSEYERSFLFKIDGAYPWDNEIEIDGLKLVNGEYFMKQNAKRFKYDREKQFLSHPATVVAYKAKGYSQDEAVESAINELTNKLHRIGFILDKKLTLNTFGYLIPVEGNAPFVMNEIYHREHLSDRDSRTLQNRNTVVNSDVFDSFLKSLEDIFAAAHSEVNRTRSLHYYQKTVEYITSGTLAGINQGANNFLVPPEILAMGYLLLLLEKEEYRFDIRRWAYTVIINSNDSSEDVVGLDKDYINKIRLKKTLPSLTELFKQFKNEHAQYRLRKAYRYNDSLYASSAFHYYVRFFLELKKYRNVIEHRNNDDEQLSRKLHLSVNTLMWRIYLMIVKELSKPNNANKKPQEVINALILQGKNLAVSLGISV